MNSSKKIKDQQEKEAVSTVSVPEKKVKKAKKISRFAGVDKKPVILVTYCCCFSALYRGRYSAV